jgi:hypothetical protein
VTASRNQNTGELRGIGYDKAVADSLKLASDRIAVAHEVEQEVAKDHATKNDDSAFDQDFKRQ